MNKFVIYGSNEFAKKLLKNKSVAGVIIDEYNDLITKKKKFKLKDLIKKNYNIIICTKSPQDIAVFHYLKLYLKEERIFNRNFQLFNNKNVDFKISKITSNIKKIKKKILKYKVISFDLFETICDRKISRPIDIYDLASKQIKNKNYINLRKKIENKLLNKTKFKYSYDDIKQEFLRFKNYDKTKIKKIINMEKEIELRLLFLRSEIFKLVIFAKNKGKKVILVSDTHHNKYFIKKILNKLKIDIFDEIYLSSETGMSKFDADIYTFLNNKYKNNLLHIGDNYKSDYINAKKKKISAVIIPNLNNVILNSKFAKIFAFNKDFFCKIFIGLLKYRINVCISKKINEKRRYLFNDHVDFGYIFIGILNLLILIFLFEISQKKKIDKILLFSREGYFVNKGLKYIKKYLKFPKFIYFYTSRKISILSSLKNLKDIINSFSRHRFEGNLNELLERRFEIKKYIKNQQNNIFINSVKNKLKLNKILKKYEKEILASSLYTREKYLIYLKKVINQNENIAMFDQGFFGTTQSMIEKIMNRKFYGVFLSYYKYEKKRFGLFNYRKSNFRDFQIFFESLYTSPHGSVKNISSKNKFVFNKIEKNQKDFRNRNKLFEGVFKLISDFNYIYPLNSKHQKLKINKDIINLADTLFVIFREHKFFISPNIKKVFFHENTFVKEKKYILKI